jgi:hypothetical protein
MEREDYESDEYADEAYEDSNESAYEDIEPVEPPPRKERKIKLTDLPSDVRFINVVHKETYETRRMTPNQFEYAKIDGWIIDKSIHL